MGPRIDASGSTSTYDPGVDSGATPLDIVRLGETTLSQVAARLGVDPNSLLQANPQISDPAKLTVGQEVRLPTGQASQTPAPDPGSVAPSTASPLGASMLDDPISKAQAQFQLVGSGQNASPLSAAAPVRVADAGDDLRLEVRNAAAHLVGRPVVGSGECYDLADRVLRESSAKSAPDFGKVTRSEKENYKWGTPIDLKDAKPGDILQFRDHKITIATEKKIKKTYPDGHSTTSEEKSSEELNRGQHTAILLANNGDGTMVVAEQHVIDHRTGALSTTVRRNILYIGDITSSTYSKVFYEQNIRIEEVTTITTMVTGIIWAYEPQSRGD